MAVSLAVNLGNLDTLLKGCPTAFCTEKIVPVEGKAIGDSLPKKISLFAAQAQPREAL
jgi:hypothetical protein